MASVVVPAGSPTHGGGAAGPCRAFRSNLYRPALCVGCFHDIAGHFPGLWKAKTDFATGRRVYVNTQTGAVLNPRPGDVAAASGGDGDGATRRTNPLADALGAEGVVDARSAGWGEFAARLDGGGEHAPPGKVDARGAKPGPPPVQHAGPPRVHVDALLHESPLATAGLLSPSEHVPELPSGVPVSALANMAINLSALTAALVAGGGGGGGGDGGAASPSHHHTHDAAFSLGPSAAVAFAPTPVGFTGGLTPTPPPPKPPRTPTAATVPAEAVGAPPPPPPPPPPAVAVATSTATALPPTPPPVPRPPPPRAPPALVGDSPGSAAGGASEQLQQLRPPGGGGEGTAGAVAVALRPPPPSRPPAPGGGDAGPTAAATTTTAATTPTPIATSGGGGGVDLSPFLAPLFADPLLLDLAALSREGSGVTVIPIKQPFEESFSLPRLLLVTPFTIIAVAAHPTLGARVGILKWERSLLSLRHLATQPLVRKLPPAPAPADGGGGGGGVRGFFARRRAGSTTAATTGGSGDGELPHHHHHGADYLLGGAGGGGSAPRPIGGGLGVYGVGVLASFAAETHDTITFLRTYRAGRRAVALEGWLSKRKQSSWREHAPLGPLAWKRRWFVLGPHALTYYSAQPPAGDDAGARKLLKGVVPLTGWVEVTRQQQGDAAEGGGGGGKHAFVVRTGTTYHLFTAASAGDADAWVAAIAVNAQHVGAAQHEPQCLELPSASVASEVAAAIVQRRRQLVEAMSLRARAELGDGAELHLDIMNELLPAGGGSAARPALRGGGGRGAAFDYVGGDFYSGEPVDPDAVVCGMSVREAHAVVLTASVAAGGSGDNEVLAQLPPALAAAVRQYQAQLDGGLSAAGGGGGLAGPRAVGALPPLAPGEGAWCVPSARVGAGGGWAARRGESCVCVRPLPPSRLAPPPPRRRACAGATWTTATWCRARSATRACASGCWRATLGRARWCASRCPCLSWTPPRAPWTTRACRSRSCRWRRSSPTRRTPSPRAAAARGCRRTARPSCTRRSSRRPWGWGCSARPSPRRSCR